MRIEVITIGTELLSGKTLDTNFAYLAKRCSQEGIVIHRHLSIPDDPKQMEKCFLEAMERSDIVLTTGGLGPTVDDHTKAVVAKVFNQKLVTNPMIKEDLLSRYGSQMISLEHQSLVPEEAELLKNTVGTACGFLLKKGKNSFFVMPGVPSECYAMFENEVLNQLKKLIPEEERWITTTVYLCHLSEGALDPSLRELQETYPSVEAGIYPGYGVLHVEFKTKRSPDATALLDKCIKKILNTFGQYVISTDHLTLPEAIHRYMVTHKKSLIIAESCTGGHLAAKLVNLAGASEYFLGSIVCYSNLLKTQVLGVKEETLTHYGAVSYETVKEMLQGALALSGADYALALSGIAGPSGGNQEKPIGTVWCGLGVKGEAPHIEKILAKGRGKRETVIEYTANFMLGLLWRQLAYNQVSS
jgi:nicotinamide-nucleotide amidase